MPCDSTPRSLLGLIFKSSAKHCARQRERNFVADFVVLRAANDLARLSAAVIDLANAQAVGVRVWRRSVDLRDDDVVEVRTALFDSFDLDAGKREQFGQLFDARRQLDKFAQPVNGEFHAARCHPEPADGEGPPSRKLRYASDGNARLTKRQCWRERKSACEVPRRLASSG